MSPQEVTDKLQLSQLRDKVWYVVPSCATTGEGLFEGLVCLMIPFQTHWQPVLIHVLGLAVQQCQVSAAKAD